MNFSRPALALFASVLASAACSGTEVEPNPGNTAGSVGTAGNPPSGGSSATAGAPGAGTGTGGSAAGSASAGTSPGGSTGTSGSGSGGGGAAGASSGAGGGGSSAGGSGGGSNNAEGPCDIYSKGGTPCVAAYSTIRRLLSTYTGPLYQVRSGSNAMNTGTGGMTHDIPQVNGFADIAAQNTACANTTCTVSKLYDQSGKGNHITVAKAGLTNGGQYAGMDDFETTIGRSDTKDKIKVGGRDVFSLYMEARQGYRQTMVGTDMPVDDEPQGIYMLADGTRTGTACCWDFGNVTPNPKSYAEMNTLFFGVAFWGKGAGNGPWFGADIEAGVWMGGSTPGSPGWGALDTAANAPANTNNPSLKVKYALGFLKTGNGPERYALRMADAGTATTVTTAYAGAYPQGRHLDSQGAVVLGVGGDNSNNSFSTFYEGAIVQGFPTDASEDAILQNIKALGYGQ